MKDKQVHWNLDHVLKRDQFNALHKKIERQLPRYFKFFRKLKPSMSSDAFREYLEFNEKLLGDLSRLYDLPFLMETVNQTDPKAKQLKQKALDLHMEYLDAQRRPSHWIKGKSVEGKKRLDKVNAKRLYRVIQELRYTLERGRIQAKYMLSPSEEAIISRKQAIGRTTLLELRGLAETEQKYQVRIGKKNKTMRSSARLKALVYSSSAEYRKAAYISLFKVYKQNLLKYFLIYQAVVKDWAHEVELRGYSSPISIRNFSNNIEDETVDVLISTCLKNTALFHDYFRKKARLLGQKRLKRYDLYAPVTTDAVKRIRYTQAVDLALKTFAGFNKGFYTKAKKMINEGHIDSHPAPMKQNGAFAATVNPKITPYILLNYTGTERDVMVLAHELGHGIHSLYANQLPISVQHPTLPLAETASTFAELLVFEQLMATAASPKARQRLLFDKIADSYATIMRQIFFLIFEKQAHESIRHGTTAEELSDLYFQSLKEQFGAAVSITHNFRYEWAYIPHLVRSPFYVYSYSFGQLLSLALYSNYKQNGNSFLPKLEKILSSGGSKNPAHLLRSINVDIGSESFWQGGFDIIKKWVDQI